MRSFFAIPIPLLLIVTACRQGDAHAANPADSMAMMHANHGTTASGTTVAVPDDTTLPPDAAHALARLNASPRHGEYVMIPDGQDSIRAWVSYPVRNSPAPVVVVVHEIFGMSTWVRSVADQLAAAGFIVIAPDLLSKQHLPGSPDSVSMQDGIAAVSKLNPADVQRQIDAAARYAMAFPSAEKKYGVLGFCWGGGVAFEHAVHAPTLGAAVLYYGTSPKTETLSSVKAPILGLYGGEDARVVMTIPPADSALHAQGKTFKHTVYDGATHGFLRDQGGAAGANLRATQQAWPATLAWLHEYLGR